MVKRLNIERRQIDAHQFTRNEGMLGQLLHGNAVIFVHLQTLDHEEAGFDADGFIEANHVATIVDFCN